MNKTILRSLSGLIFLIIMTGSLLIGPIIFSIVMIFSLSVMIMEFLDITTPKVYKNAKYLTILTGALFYIMLFLYIYYGISVRFILLIIIPITLIYAVILFTKQKDGGMCGPDYKTTSNMIMSLVYIALPFSLINLILFNSSGDYNYKIIISLFILLWSSDVGAYIFGMTFGQKRDNKLYRSVSPNKSWEGFWGGVFCTIIVAILLNSLSILSIGLIHTIIISIIISIFGVIGDLFESLLKRNYEVKDSGKLMPGHGGLLDRFDGALISFPIAIAYIKFFELL